MRKFVFAATIAATAALALPAVASAQSYDIRAGYGSSVFAYGSGTGGGSFTAFSTDYAGGCFGVAAIACKANGSNNTVPVAAVNNGATATNFATTVDLPNTVLLLHPGSAAAGDDAILQFIAPTASTYVLNGVFSRLDNQNGSGNGVNLAIFGPGGASLFTGSLANTPQSVSSSFSNLSVFLNAGDRISFAVNNAGEYQYDSTGLSGSIQAVPEPASWALMILGFGFAGYAMRRRARTTVSFA